MRFGVKHYVTCVSLKSLTSISTSDSVSLPLVKPLSESLHSDSKLHSEALRKRRAAIFSAWPGVASSEIRGKVGRSLSVGRRCRRVRLLSFHTRRWRCGT